MVGTYYPRGWVATWKRPILGWARFLCVNRLNKETQFHIPDKMVKINCSTTWDALSTSTSGGSVSPSAQTKASYFHASLPSALTSKQAQSEPVPEGARQATPCSSFSVYLGSQRISTQNMKLSYKKCIRIFLSRVQKSLSTIRLSKYQR